MSDPYSVIRDFVDWNLPYGAGVEEVEFSEALVAELDKHFYMLARPQLVRPTVSGTDDEERT